MVVLSRTIYLGGVQPHMDEQVLARMVQEATGTPVESVSVFHFFYTKKGFFL